MRTSSLAHSSSLPPLGAPTKWDQRGAPQTGSGHYLATLKLKLGLGGRASRGERTLYPGPLVKLGSASPQFRLLTCRSQRGSITLGGRAATLIRDRSEGL